MSALAPGKIAPNFTLPITDGGTFSLAKAQIGGPVVLAFFKVSCPVCQYAFPFLERIYRARGSSKASLIGVSQNEAKDTAAFLKEFGITFPTLLEDTDKFAVSDAYGLTNVPTVFWIAENGTIEISSVGWSRPDTEEIYRRVGGTTNEVSPPLFLPSESVPEYRPG